MALRSAGRGAGGTLPPSRARLRRFLAANGVLPEWVAISRNDGSTFLMTPGRPLDLVVEIIWTRGSLAFEEPLPAILSALPLGPGSVAVVGANSGYYVLLLAARAPVIAFEPYPPARKRLMTNLAANRIEVDVRPEAVSDAAGRLPLFAPMQSADWPLESSASLSVEFKGADRVTRGPEVDVVRFDDAVPSPVSLILVDAEGVDMQVLAGADRTVRESRPYVVVEIEEKDRTALETFADQHDYLPLRPTPAGLSRSDGTRPGTVNHGHVWVTVLIPRERMSEASDALTAAGLSVDGD